MYGALVSVMRARIRSTRSGRFGLLIWLIVRDRSGGFGRSSWNSATVAWLLKRRCNRSHDLLQRLLGCIERQQASSRRPRNATDDSSEAVAKIGEEALTQVDVKTFDSVIFAAGVQPVEALKDE